MAPVAHSLAALPLFTAGCADWLGIDFEAPPVASELVCGGGEVPIGGYGGLGGMGGSGASGGGGAAPAVCGDGIVQQGEECDDNNEEADDGCADCACDSKPSGWAPRT